MPLINEISNGTVYRSFMSKFLANAKRPMPTHNEQKDPPIAADVAYDSLASPDSQNHKTAIPMKKTNAKSPKTKTNKFIEHFPLNKYPNIARFP